MIIQFRRYPLIRIARLKNRFQNYRPGPAPEMTFVSIQKKMRSKSIPVVTGINPALRKNG